jgi:hypothetical protein
MSCSATSAACNVYDAEIHQGAEAPYSVSYDITSSDADFDLSTATAATFSVRRENGSEDTWSAVISPGATATTATIVHVFAAGDVPDCELLTLVPVLATPSGDFYADPKTLKVKKVFDL